jgi:hypothetical protein
MSENYIPIKLPSKGKAYPADVNLSAISIRVTKGKDEKIIAEITNDNFEKKFLMLMQSVMKGIDPSILTFGDRKFVMIWLAINSISAKHPVTFACHTCLQDIEVEADLSKFEIKELPDDFVVPKEIRLSDRSVNVRLLTVGDEIKVSEYEHQGRNPWLYRYALSIVPKDKQTVWDIVNELEEMSSADIAKIRAFHEVYDHGPVMESGYECPKCGGVGRVSVPFRLEMLFPYGDTLKNTFGKEL